MINHQTMKTYRLLNWPILMLCALATPFVLLGQTNAAPAFDPATAPLPTGKNSFWAYGIAFVTPLIVAGVRKLVPKIPTQLLAVSTPFVGLALGGIMHQLGVLNLDWIDYAKMGGLAVLIREVWNQNVTNGLLKSKAPVTAALLLGTVLLTGSGCSTLSPTDIQRISAATKVAAYVGTSTALRQHPEWKDAFAIASDNLKVLETADTLDVAQILAIIQRLPIKELKSDTAAIIITSATILITEFNVSTIPLERVKQLQPIVKSIRQGIDLGRGLP